MLIDLPTAKAHIRDEEAPADQVTLYLRAAEMSAAQFLNRRIFETSELLAAAVAAVPADLTAAALAYANAVDAAGEIDDYLLQQESRAYALEVYTRAVHASREIRAGIVINELIKAAILLTFGHLYASREDVVVGATASALPEGSKHLLQPFRCGLGV